jgi:hypothetical protein
MSTGWARTTHEQKDIPVKRIYRKKGETPDLFHGKVLRPFTVVFPMDAKLDTVSRCKMNQGPQVYLCWHQHAMVDKHNHSLDRRK